MKRKEYRRPQTRVVEIQQRGLLMQSGGKGTLGGYRNSGGNAWDDSGSGDGSSMGGWTDSGDDPWQ